MWSYWVQRAGIWLVIILSMIASPLIIMEIVDGDIFAVSLYIIIIAGIFFIIQPVSHQWIYIVCTVTIIASINFLPLNFSFFEIAVLLVGVHFVIEYVIIRHRGFRRGNFVALSCILIICGILSYHWFKQGIGFKIFGSEEVGARKNFSAILGCFAYILIVTLGKGQWKRLNQIPFFYFLTSMIMLIPFVATTYFPGMTPYAYRFLSNVNMEAYQAQILNADSLGRIGELGAFAQSLEIFLISKYPVKTWWRPERWWVVILFLISLALCLRGGFRSALFSFILIAGIGFYISLGIKSLWLALLGILILSVLSVGNNTFFQLPLSVQRTLSFLPGQWDPQVLATTESSNDFRHRIQTIYLNEYMHRSPLIGNGFNYNKQVLVEYDPALLYQGLISQYDFHKGFIERKDYHIGWISLYDTVGIAGGISFIILFGVNSYLFFKCFKLYFNKQVPPILVWTVVQTLANFASYFAVFGAFQEMLPLMCVLSAITYLVYECGRNRQHQSNNEVVLESK
jgi:hypothetical protein